MAYFRDKFKSILKINDTPHRIAMAFAIGVLAGISPFLGLHYIGGILLAWMFRLNRLVAIVGVSVNNPWTIVPISSFNVWIGAKLMGIRQVLPEVDWQNVTLVNILGKLTDFDNFIIVLKQLLPLLEAFIVGSLIMAVITAIFSYFVIQELLKKYRKVRNAA